MTARGYLVACPNRLDAISKQYDVVVVGAGIAGMTAALSLDSKLKVALISKEKPSKSSTYKAQGGMAVAVGHDDSCEEHISDTLRVGQGLCRKDAVDVLVREGPLALEFLQGLGADFCHDEKGLVLTREAGHSRNRVVHYYDYTGKYIAELLTDEVKKSNNIDIYDRCFLVDILTVENDCCGCAVIYEGRLLYLQAGVVIIATGGYSGLFSHSTNSDSVSGDGIAAAYRAGAVISDMEFVQFHPTAFSTTGGNIFLLTEALRGEGAVLLNSAGERFMQDYHASAELAPRDEVSRAILRESAKQGGSQIYLDARHLGREYLADRFPQVYTELAQNNFFMEKDIIPIAPAAHYTIGGINTDLWGKSNVTSLYSCGEAAATGVHGANRLASNSLLEGIVFGRRVAAHINVGFKAKNKNANFASGVSGAYCDSDVDKLRLKLDSTAGVIRSGSELKETLRWIKGKNTSQDTKADIHTYHMSNAFQLAELMLTATLLREESRGGHYRLDFPNKDEHFLYKHILHQWGKEAVFDE
ncbi:L-aspartate oxidase [Dendrosporobacter sp. 1207_IL3150]|uniref:L-aspartate oxidase n=1 Tax=Dendrosporobacter sp. 1207_IL3150 TaxID=3084054 RepID=UPI002FD99085